MFLLGGDVPEDDANPDVYPTVEVLGSEIVADFPVWRCGFAAARLDGSFFMLGGHGCWDDSVGQAAAGTGTGSIICYVHVTGDVSLEQQH